MAKHPPAAPGEFDRELTRVIEDLQRRVDEHPLIATYLPAETLVTVREFLAQVRSVAGAAKGGSAHGLAGALKTLGATLVKLLNEHAQAHIAETLTKDGATKLEDASRKLEKILRTRDHELAAVRVSADRRVAEERARGDADAERLQQQLTDAQTVATTSGDAILAACTAWVRESVRDMDDCIRMMGAHAQHLARLKTHDVPTLAELETIEVPLPGGGMEERPFEDEAASLAADGAKFTGREKYKLDEAALRELTDVLARHDHIVARRAEITNLLRSLESKFRDATDAVTACKQRWNLGEQDRAAIERMNARPDIFSGADIFTVADISRGELDRKRRMFMEIAQRCNALSGGVIMLLNGFTERTNATAAAMDRLRTELAELRDAHDIAWFHALADDVQQRTQAAVLAFDALGKRGEQVGCRTIAELCVAAGICAEDDGTEDQVYECLQRAFFTPAHPNPAMQEKMRIFRLTAEGEYWREAWTQQDPALATRLRDAAARRAQASADEEVQRRANRDARERQRKQREEECARDATARAAAEADAERRRTHPSVIISHLSFEAQQLLAVMLETLPHLPASGASIEPLIKCAAAAAAANLLPRTQPATAARALTMICDYDPPLIGVTMNGDGKSNGIAATPIAQRLQPLLPTIAAKHLDSIRTLVARRASEWPEHDHQVFRAVHERVHRNAPTLQRVEQPKT